MVDSMPRRAIYATQCRVVRSQSSVNIVHYQFYTKSLVMDYANRSLVRLFLTLKCKYLHFCMGEERRTSFRNNSDTSMFHSSSLNQRGYRLKIYFAITWQNFRQQSTETAQRYLASILFPHTYSFPSRAISNDLSRTNAPEKEITAVLLHLEGVRNIFYKMKDDVISIY